MLRCSARAQGAIAVPSAPRISRVTRPTRDIRACGLSVGGCDWASQCSPRARTDGIVLTTTRPGTRRADDVYDGTVLRDLLGDLEHPAYESGYALLIEAAGRAAG